MTRALWPKLQPAFVQQALEGHKWLGLALCALMYLVCLSGTVTVFYPDMERWETPRYPDLQAAAPAAMAAALADARAAHPGAKSLALIPPTPASPRLRVEADEVVRVYDRAGRYLGGGDHPVTHALTSLHYALTLPSAVGLVIVGVAGVGLAGLLVGGLMAHPRILRDAFLWRWRSGARLSLADLHNRIGVWAAPFHLVIALTGAVIGLASVVLFAAALVMHQGDTAKASEPLFGPQPAAAARSPVTGAATARALAQVEARLPGTQPSYIRINQPGTGRESLTVIIDLPRRLAYGETFEFDGTGAFIASHHLTDGSAGKQLYASLYKLHFGSFGGRWVAVAYAVLGLGLTALCATGTDLWLVKSAQRGRPRPRLAKLWAGFVWGGPSAMAAAAGAGLFAGQGAVVAVFWAALLAVSLAALALPDQRAAARAGRALAGLLLVLLVAIHAARFDAAAATGAAGGLNQALLAIGLMLIALSAGERLLNSRPGQRSAAGA